MRASYRPGSCPQQKRSAFPRESSFAIGVDRTRISCRCCWNYGTACDFPRRKSHIIVLGQRCAAGNPVSDRAFRGPGCPACPGVPWGEPWGAPGPSRSLSGHSHCETALGSRSSHGNATRYCLTMSVFPERCTGRDACAAFVKESRMKCTGATKQHRKSGCPFLTVLSRSLSSLPLTSCRRPENPPFP